MDGEVDGWGYKMILLCGNRLKISSMGLGCLLYPDNSCRPLLEMKGKEEHTLFFSPNIGVVANRSAQEYNIRKIRICPFSSYWEVLQPNNLREAIHVSSLTTLLKALTVASKLKCTVSPLIQGDS